jgi:hypothetical protein
MIPTRRTTIGKRPPKTIESTHPHETPPWPLTLSPLEWKAKRASAPRTLSFAHIDLMHRTHVLKYYDTAVGKYDPFTSFPPPHQQLQPCSCPPVRYRINAQALLHRKLVT